MLKGSEKQIRWAEDIKTNMIDKIRKADMEYHGLENADKVLAKLEEIEDPGWFIDHRNSISSIVDVIVYEIGIYTDDEITEMAEKIKENERIMKRLANKENNQEITKTMIAQELGMTMGISIEKIFNFLTK